MLRLFPINTRELHPSPDHHLIKHDNSRHLFNKQTLPRSISSPDLALQIDTHLSLLITIVSETVRDTESAKRA